jgi:hypothetical protein
MQHSDWLEYRQRTPTNGATVRCDQTLCVSFQHLAALLAHFHTVEVETTLAVRQAPEVVLYDESPRDLTLAISYLTLTTTLPFACPFST